MIQLNNKQKQVVLFGLGGLIGVLIGYMILYLLAEKLNIFYVYPVILAHFANQSFNFCFQKYVVFKNTEKTKILSQLFSYTIWILCTLGVNALMVYILTSYCGLYYFVSQIIMTTILSVVNFLVTKKIFKNKTL